MTESVPDYRIDEARTRLDEVVRCSVRMGTRHDDAVSVILADYVNAAERAAAMIDICNEERRIQNALATVDSAREQIEYLKTKLL